MRSSLPKVLLTLGLATLGAACSKAPASSDSILVIPATPGPVPPDWYKPDSGTAQNPAQPTPRELITSTDLLFQTTSQAIQDSQEHSILSARNSPWAPRSVMTDLGLTTSGWLGGVLKGTAAVTLVWKPVEEEESKPEDNRSPGPATSTTSVLPDHTFLVSDAMTREDILAQLEPAIRGVISAGYVHSESRLRNTLMLAAEKLLDTTQGISMVAGRCTPSRFRLELSVDAKGSVSGVESLGGDIRFRFEWFKSSQTNIAESRPLSRPSLELARLAQTLATEASSVAEGTPHDEFLASSFRIGIGVGAKGEIGLVSGGAATMGHVYYDCAKPGSKAIAEALDVHPLLGGIGSAADADLPSVAIIGARETRIAARSAIRQGLQKAFEITRFFADRAVRAKTGAWQVTELKTGFDTSLSGSFGLSSVSQSVSAEITFKKQ